MPRHTRLTLSHRARWAAAGLTLGLIFGGGIAFAALPGGQVTCTPGADLLVHGDGTWTCGPEPTPTGGTPSPTTSAAPPSPSGSASPSSTPTASASPSPPTSSSTPPPSTSPSPSSTPTRNCLNQLAACGFPNAANTGPNGTLSVVNGNVTLSTAGMVYADKDVRGCVRVTAPNVTIRNTKITCADMDHGGDYVRVRSNSTNLTLIDTEIDCVDGYGMAIGFREFTLIRSDLHGCENGGHIDANVTVRDSWIHDLKGPADAHFDGFQTGQGVSNVAIIHSVIHNPQDQTSAIGLWDEGGAQANNIRIEGNLLAGGGWTLYCGRFGTAVNVVITGNRFVAGQYGYANACDSGGEVWSGNVRDVDGVSIGAM